MRLNIFGRTSVGIIQYRVIGTSPPWSDSLPVPSPSAQNQLSRGNGVIITNCANVTPALSAISTVASNVAGLSVGSPKMKSQAHARHAS